MVSTIIAFTGGERTIECYTGPDLLCVDMYGSEGGDWTGGVDDLYGVYGNISEDPLFCARDSENYTLQNDSPCAPGGHAECDLIGAWPVGCDPAGLPDASVAGRITRIFPNPSRGPIVIDFHVPSAGWVSAYIVDASGRLVRNLFDGGHPNTYAGELSFTWDGRDDCGRRMPSGVYLARVAGPDGVRIGSIVLAR
jgi:hypothetical protein